MKKSLALAFGILITSYGLEAQTPSSFQNSGVRRAGAGGLAANSPWLGAQVGYKFGSSSDFADNLLVSGRYLHEIPFKNAGNFHLPVMGNISALKNDITDVEQDVDTIKAKVEQLLLSPQGVNVGLFPYYVISDSENLMVTLHSVISWKLNGFKNNENVTQYLNQGRFAVGLEAQLGATDNARHRLVISVAPTISVFNENDYEKIFNESRSSIVSLEVTGVVPLGGGVGILAEGIIAEDEFSTFRVGLVLSAEAGD